MQLMKAEILPSTDLYKIPKNKFEPMYYALLFYPHNLFFLNV
jgi:hypothetical protein